MFTNAWWRDAVQEALDLKWEEPEGADASEEPPNRLTP